MNPNRPAPPRNPHRIRARRKGHTVGIQLRPRALRGVAVAGAVGEGADPAVMRAGGEVIIGFWLLAVCDGAGAVGVGFVPELGDVFLEGFLFGSEGAGGWVVGVGVGACLAEADGDGVGGAEGCDGLGVGHGV